MSGMTPPRSEQPAQPEHVQAEPVAFTPVQKAAWAGFLRTHATITRALSHALEERDRLTITEFELLLALSPGENLRLTRLAQRLYLSTSGLTGLIERLARRGLIERCTHPDDARAGYLRLTDAGRAVFDTACAGHVQRVQRLFLGRFSTVEQQLLAQLWARFPDDPPTESRS
jgi:DNA-binding MarR family transcriptional regulator